MPSGRFEWLLNPPMLVERWRSFLRLLKSPLDTAFFHSLRLLLNSPTGDITRTVLLLRVDGVGDFVFFARYLAVVREIYRDFKIVFVCRKEVAPLARCVDGIDEVMELDAKTYQWNFIYRIFFLKRIRQYSLHTAIYLSYHRRHLGDEIALLSSAKQRIAFTGNDEIIRPAIRKRNNRYYTILIETPDHISEETKYRRMFEVMAGKSTAPLSPVITLRKEYQHQKPNGGSPSAIIAPGSTSRLRRWPAERFSAIADEISARYGLQMILCGDRSEHSLLNSVSASMKQPQKILGNASLEELIGVFKMARLFVGNDAGLLHLAASLGVPAVGIVGGGHFNRYFPYGTMEVASNILPCFECNWKCKFRQAYCVTEISVESVMKAVDKLFQRTGRSPVTPSH